MGSGIYLLDGRGVANTRVRPCFSAIRVEAYNRHVMVLRDGTMRGGGGYYYTVGSYTCSGGKWKGEMTSREHSPIEGTYPWARKDLSIGFTGTYSDDGAEFEATALAGKRSFRFKSSYRLLFAD